jgi:hypothetical protein
VQGITQGAHINLEALSLSRPDDRNTRRAHNIPAMLGLVASANCYAVEQMLRIVKRAERVPSEVTIDGSWRELA